MNSVADLKILVTNKDAAYAALGKQLQGLASEWQTKDPSGWGEVSSLWSGLQTRYKAARDAAEAAVTIASTIPLPNDLIPANDAYEGIVRADNAVQGVVSSGDLQDIYNRIAAFNRTASQKVDMTVPVPVQVTQDTGSAFLQKTDPVGHAVDAAVDTVKHPGSLMPSPGGWWAKQPFPSKVGYVAIGGTVFLLLIKGLRRSTLI